MVTKRMITAEELLYWPDDGKNYELVRGELRELPFSSYRQGCVSGRIGFLIGQHVRRYDLGAALGGRPGFILERDPDTVRAPHVAFLSKDRIPPKERQQGYPESAPDLTVEVLYMDERRSDLDDRIHEYFAAGGRMVWVVDPEAETVGVYCPDVKVITLSTAEFIEGYDVLPGFRCRVAEFFARGVDHMKSKLRALFVAVEINLLLWLAACGQGWVSSGHSGGSWWRGAVAIDAWLMLMGLIFAATVQHWAYYAIRREAGQLGA